MGTKHLFGRTIDHRHIPIADDEDVAAYELASARMYASAPSLAQKQYTDTSGVVGTAKTSWTEVSPGEYKILFDRVTDPSPDSDDDYEQYWVVVQFTLESGGDTVFTEDVIFLWRPDAMNSKFRVTPPDVYARERKIEKVQPTTDFTHNKIEIAVVEVDRVLRSRGYSRKRTFNRESMNEAVALLATADACLDLASENGEIWLKKEAIWRSRYDAAVNSIPLGYDVDGDGEPEADEQVFGGAVALLR